MGIAAFRLEEGTGSQGCKNRSWHSSPADLEYPLVDYLFGLHSPVALVEIVFLWLAILATIVAFYKTSKPAAWLLIPYIAWVSFARI